MPVVEIKISNNNIINNLIIQKDEFEINKSENNFVLTKESELSFEIEIIKDQEPKKDLNNENNSNKIIINNNYNNPFLLAKLKKFISYKRRYQFIKGDYKFGTIL